MANRIITISREFGSGGRTIGNKVAERFGIPCYDQDAIEALMSQAEQVFAGKKEKGTDPRKWLAEQPIIITIPATSGETGIILT